MEMISQEDIDALLYGWDKDLTKADVLLIKKLDESHEKFRKEFINHLKEKNKKIENVDEKEEQSDIITKKDYNYLFNKIESLNKRCNNLEEEIKSLKPK